MVPGKMGAASRKGVRGREREWTETCCLNAPPRLKFGAGKAGSRGDIRGWVPSQGI